MSTEIPIWVNGKIRWLSGIDKKTTCKDVVEILLEGEGIGKSEAKDFTIMERWRKVERQLDENSKILKIWSHWGNEKKEVRLCLRRIDNEVDSGRGSPVCSGYIPTPRRKRNRIRGHGKPPWACRETLHPRRLAELGRFDKKEYDDYPHVKTKHGDVINDHELLNDTNAYDNKIYYEKDVNDTENVNSRKVSDHKSYHCSGTGRLHSTPMENHSKRQKCCSKRESKQRVRNSENIEKLMKLILAQGVTIQNQLQKLKEREQQIELLEHERHRERIEKNGRNYLLETYLGSLKDAEIPEDPNNIESENPETRLRKDGRIYGKTSPEHGREDSSCSSKSLHKNTRSKSESRTQECKFEGNLKRTLSDNALAETISASNEEEDSQLVTQNTKEEFEEVVELRKIQSQIEMWEKVFKINKKLEKEEENLVRLHIKIKKIQSENYRVVKDKKKEAEEEKETISPNPSTKSELNDGYEKDCAELEKSLETLRSDLEQNSREIYENFTKLLEEDEIVEQKRSCLSKIMTDLERTNQEHEMLNEMVAMRQNQNFQPCEPDYGVTFERLPTKESDISPNVVGLPQDNVNQRADTNDQEVPLQVKPKIVKISFEEKVQNYESSESPQNKDPVPVPQGALKSILKNRKKSFSKTNELADNHELKPPDKNLSLNDCYTENHYIPDRVNTTYPYTIPYPLYVNIPNENNGPPQLIKHPENTKTVGYLRNGHPPDLSRTFPPGAVVTTKALVHNDTDSSTSSDTSGLSSMYSSSTNAEEPYVEKSYVLDTLV